MRYAAILLLVTLAGCSGPQPDAKMQSYYESKKAYFSALVTGAECHIEKNKILFRSDVKKNNPACLKLLDEVGARGIGVDPFSGGIMVFPSWSNFSSGEKGYIFSGKKLDPLYLSLDEHPADLQPYKKGFKKIDDKWYIYYEYNN